MVYSQKMRALLLLLGCAISSQAVGGEFFECKDSDPMAEWNHILVTLYTGDDETSPFVRVAPVTHRAIYKVVGSDRRWDFPSHYFEEDKPGYSVVIALDGKAEYFDFTRAQEGESVPAHKRFECRLVPGRTPPGPAKQLPRTSS